MKMWTSWAQAPVSLVVFSECYTYELYSFISVMRFFSSFKLDVLKENNLKNEEELNKSKELLNLENKKVEELRKE